MAGRALEKIGKQFVNSIAVDDLLDQIVRKVVLKEEEVEEVNENMTKEEQSRALIDNVKENGPKVNRILVRLLESDDRFFAKELGLKTFLPDHQPEEKGASPLESRNGITLCPLSLFEKIQVEEASEIYPLGPSETRTRLALVICNIEFEHLPKRNGAEVDLEQMTLLLEGLGYCVEIEINLSSQDMANCLQRFAAREEHKASDSTFLVLMSHGLRDRLCGVQSRAEGSDILSVDTIFSTFNNKNCPGLRGKPKVIVIQACRGANRGYTYVSDSATSEAVSLSPVHWPLEVLESDAIQKVHVESDFICLYSTTPDHVSWRSPLTGSIFIVQLIKHIMEHAWNCNLEEIFRKILQSFEENPCQMPSKDRTTLTKKFYLFPGH